MLTNEQLEEFHERGVVRMPGAVAQSAVEEMLRNVWKCLRERYHIHRGAPDTWPELDDRGVHQVIGVQRFTGSHHLPKSEKFAAVCNAVVCGALDQILGANRWQRPERWGSLLVAFPESRDVWDVPASGWHLDLPATHRSSGLMAARIFTCLATIAHGAGGTLVVAGSPRLVQSLVRTGERIPSAEARKRMIRAFPWIAALCSRDEKENRVQRFMRESTLPGGIRVRVVELAGEAGDVFLVHPMMLHAGSKNCSTAPRMALSATVFGSGVEQVKLYP